MGRLEIQDPDDATWERGELRLRVLSPLLAEPRTTNAAVEAAARQLGIERSQCYRLLRKLRAERTVTTLLPATGGRRRGAKLLGDEVEAIIAASIEEFYLSRRSPRISDLMREIGHRCTARQIASPSRKAVAGRLDALDPYEVMRRRKGAATARRTFGRIRGHLEKSQPLGLVQIDHTLADVMVVSTGDRRPLKRPWLTLAIDVATRMVTGFFVSLEPPSALSVALALTRAVLPKDAFLQARGLDINWPVAGLPRTLHLDNAKEFRSLALRRGVAQYGMELQYRPPATPHWGGHIERLIGTMMGALRLPPGATGRNLADRSQDPEVSAAMTLDELETWLVHQIAGVYHHSVHRSLGRAPLDAWTELTEASTYQLQVPEDPERFLLDFLPYRERIIQRSGISLFNITYSDGVLSTFPIRPDQRFIIRYDPRDMSTVYLRDEEGKYWPIPCSDRRMPAISLSEIKSASERLHTAGERDLHQRKILASVEMQRDIVDAAEADSRQTRLDRERLHRKSSVQRASRLPPTTVVASDQAEEPILPYPIEEWSR